ALQAERGLEGRITALLDRRWQPVRIRLNRGGGWLELAGQPSGYRWSSQRLPLAGLSLATGPNARWRDIEGWLSGAGRPARASHRRGSGGSAPAAIAGPAGP
ncbi:MAG: hypothetical protein ACK5E6_08715, partial [Cyanobacteriota bacterium]